MCARRVQLKTTIDGALVPLNPYTDCVKNIRLLMPLAGSKLLGTTVLYVGPQTDKYNTGICYTCKATESNSYYWDTVAVPFSYDIENSLTYLYTPDGSRLSISGRYPGTLYLQNASGLDVLYVAEGCAYVFGRGLAFDGLVYSDLVIKSAFGEDDVGRLVLGEPTELNTVEHYLLLPVQGTGLVIRKHCKVYTVDGDYAIESGLMMPFYTDNKYISVNGDDIFAEVSTSIGNGYGAKLLIYGSTYDQCTATFKVGSVNSGYLGFGIDQLHNAIITSLGLGRGILLVDNLDEYDQETGCSKFIIRDMDMTNMLYIAGEYVTDDDLMTWDYKVTAKIYDRDIAFKEDVEAVALRVAALLGNSGGSGAANITVNGVSPDADGNIELTARWVPMPVKTGGGDNIIVSSVCGSQDLAQFYLRMQGAVFNIDGNTVGTAEDLNGYHYTGLVDLKYYVEYPDLSWVVRDIEGAYGDGQINTDKHYYLHTQIHEMLDKYSACAINDYYAGEYKPGQIWLDAGRIPYAYDSNPDTWSDGSYQESLYQRIDAMCYGTFTYPNYWSATSDDAETGAAYAASVTYTAPTNGWLIIEWCSYDMQDDSYVEIDGKQFQLGTVNERGGSTWRQFIFPIAAYSTWFIYDDENRAYNIHFLPCTQLFNME